MRLRTGLYIAAISVGVAAGVIRWSSTPPEQPTSPAPPAPTDVISVKIVCAEGMAKAEPKRIEYGHYPALSKNIDIVDYKPPNLNIATVTTFNNPPDPEHRIIGSCGERPFATNFTRSRSYTVNCAFQSGGTLCKNPESN